MQRGKRMEWARILTYITGSVDEELLLRNEYLATENRILKAQIKGRLSWSSESSCQVLPREGDSKTQLS